MTTEIAPPPSVAERIADALKHFVVLQTAFAALVILLRIYELIIISVKHAVPVALSGIALNIAASDAVFLLSATGLLCLIFVPLLIVSPLWGRRLYYIVFALLGIVQFGLVQYFSVTLIPLGADFFGYTLEDIKFTVASSAGFSVTSLIPYVILAGVFFAHIRYSDRFKPGTLMASAAAGISIGMLFISPFILPSPKDFTTETAFNLSVNKTHFFAAEAVKYFTEPAISTANIGDEYPLLREFPYHDVLGPFMVPNPEKPNIVVIIAEGLGRDFVGAGARYGGFLPYIDSLTEQSLYWENFLSNSGRTFGVLPSLLGSLPFGTKGFNELDYRMPRHLSLIRLLKQNNYRVNFMYGGNKNFDKKDVFLEHEQVDLIMDESKFGDTYQKAAGDASGFTWGYPDGDVFRKAIELLAEQRPGPRLDIYLTMSTHEPFIPPNRAYYHRKFNEMMAAKQMTADQKGEWNTYRDQFSSLLYFNDALRYLIGQYSLRPDFANTIFIITGDHRIIPIPSATKLDRYHVPLIVYSPMVKQPVKFSSVSSHLDVTPTILAYLKANNALRLPPTAHWLGEGIDTAKEFRNIHSIPFMRVKEEIADYLHNDYFLSGEQLFKLRDGMEIEEVTDDAAFSTVKGELDRFRQINKYVIDQNKLYPQTIELMDDEITAEDLIAFRRIDSLSLDMDKLFMLAREKAFAKEIDEARLICRRVLAAAPNFHDVRTLLGRTYAWNKDYETAKRMFRNVIERNETYIDAYTALADAQLWSDSAEASLSIARKGLLMYPRNEDLHIRSIKALLAMGEKKEAAAVLKQLRQINPANADLPALSNRMGRK